MERYQKGEKCREIERRISINEIGMGVGGGGKEKESWEIETVDSYEYQDKIEWEIEIK